MEVVGIVGDDEYMLTASKDKVFLYSIPDLKRVGRPIELGHDVSTLLIDPARPVAISAGNHVQVWDLVTQQPMGQPIDHYRARYVQLYDSRYLISVSGGQCGESEFCLWFKVADSVGAWPDDPDAIRQVVEVMTSIECDADGNLHDLEADEWLKRRRRLEQHALLRGKFPVQNGSPAQTQQPVEGSAPGGI